MCSRTMLLLTIALFSILGKTIDAQCTAAICGWFTFLFEPIRNDIFNIMIKLIKVLTVFVIQKAHVIVKPVGLVQDVH